MLLSTFVVAFAALASASDPFADLDYDAALAQAKAQSKLLLVDFTASWCPPCKRMEKEVWPAEEEAARDRLMPTELPPDADDRDKERELERTRARFDVTLRTLRERLATLPSPSLPAEPDS